MNIEERKVSLRELYEDYFNDDEDGVVGYGERLNVRPAYQREFVYPDKKRDEVIRTVKKKFPLSIFYWSKNGDDTYEILDGQQRTISICEYIDGNFSVDGKYFDNLPEDIRTDIENYEITVYVCDGTESEKLEWFKIINIGGEELTPQELRNASFTGLWLTESKRRFSKTGCPAMQLFDDYLNGSPIRQQVFETVLGWVTDRDNCSIEDYMGRHQHDNNCNDLWLYFQTVVAWTKAVFVDYRKYMKGLDWGLMYNKYHNNTYDPVLISEESAKLVVDKDVTKNSGIYEYLLSGDEKFLSIRAFDDDQRIEAYERQKGICPKCGKHFELSEMQADHITPWSKGGKTISENCQMLCADCNRKKSNI